MKKETNCPCCPNHCDSNNLNCGKGREYFGINTDNIGNRKNHHMEKEESSMTLDEKAIHQIEKCGHFLHHSSKNVNLNFLSDMEKESLIAILSKCFNNWK